MPHPTRRAFLSGTAAALALEAGKGPRQLDAKALQQRLEREGAYLGREW